jgi:hypothetical protein
MKVVVFELGLKDRKYLFFLNRLGRWYKKKKHMPSTQEEADSMGKQGSPMPARGTNDLE